MLYYFGTDHLVIEPPAKVLQNTGLASSYRAFDAIRAIWLWSLSISLIPLNSFGSVNLVGQFSWQKEQHNNFILETNLFFVSECLNQTFAANENVSN